MRKQLEQHNEERRKFSGTFIRMGKKPGWNGDEDKTILLQNIQDEQGKTIADHLWFNYTKGFSQIGLQSGVQVEFHARVKKYLKGYQGWRDDVYKPVEVDYRLSHPTKIRIVSDQEAHSDNL